MVLGGANYSALAPPRWKHDDIITIITTFPLIISSIIITADCAIICPGRTSTSWTSRQRSHWPGRWFVLLAMSPPTWSTSGGRWWQGWWLWWWMWSSPWSYQWPSTLWHQEHYDVHDMPEGREQAMCQLCDNLHQVVVAGIMMSAVWELFVENIVAGDLVIRLTYNNL